MSKIRRRMNVYGQSGRTVELFAAQRWTARRFIAKSLTGFAILAIAAGCGSDSDSPAANASTPEPTATATAASLVEDCSTPSDAQLGRLIEAFSGTGGDFVESAVAVDPDRQVSYVAATIDGNEDQVALFRFSGAGRSASGLRAVNGTARTVTDVRATNGYSIPAAGERALACFGA